MKRQRQPRDARLFQCNSCRDGDCANCVDVMRAALGMQTLCTCTRRGHTGERGDRNHDDEVANDLVISKMEQEFRKEDP